MTASGLAIRPVAARDIGAITAIYADEVRTGVATFELAPPDVAEMAGRMQALVAGGFPYLVAERGGALLGYAYAGPYRARPAYGWAVEDSVYVAKDARRSGAGLALLNAIVAAAEKAGFRQMVAVITGAPDHASVRLHERAGFVHAGILRDVGHKHETWLDTVLMQIALGPGAGAPPGRTGAPSP